MEPGKKIEKIPFTEQEFKDLLSHIDVIVENLNKLITTDWKTVAIRKLIPILEFNAFISRLRKNEIEAIISNLKATKNILRYEYNRTKGHLDRRTLQTVEEHIRQVKKHIEELKTFLEKAEEGLLITLQNSISFIMNLLRKIPKLIEPLKTLSLIIGATIVGSVALSGFILYNILRTKRKLGI